MEDGGSAMVNGKWLMEDDRAPFDAGVIGWSACSTARWQCKPAFGPPFQLLASITPKMGQALKAVVGIIFYASG
jgi:hypothetical protein